MGMRKTTPARGGFSLVELLVAVAILVIVILSIAQIFRTVGRSVRTSNAVIEVDANARAVMRQIANDVSRIDRQGFLAIRSNQVMSTVRSQVSFIAHGTHGNRTGPLDQTSASTAELQSYAAHIYYGFLINPEDIRSNGPVRETQLVQSSPGRLTDRSLGQVDNSRQEQNIAYLGRHAFLLVPGNSAANINQVMTPSGVAVPAHRDIALTAGNIPVRTGGVTEPDAHPSAGRTGVASLTPSQLMARLRLQKYEPVRIDAHVPVYGNAASNSIYADRRVGLAGKTTGLFVSVGSGGNSFSSAGMMPQYDGSDYWCEARLFCYPFRTLREPREGTDINGAPDYVNGINRMTSILAKYCWEFRVDWTDGQTDNTGNLRWIGNGSNFSLDSLNNWNYSGNGSDPNNQPRVWPPVDFATINTSSENAMAARSVLPGISDLTPSASRALGGAPFSSGSTPLILGDNYTAIWSFDSRQPWPKALRVRMTLRVVGLEMGTGTGQFYNLPTRTYSQVIWLPQ